MTVLFWLIIIIIVIYNKYFIILVATTVNFDCLNKLLFLGIIVVLSFVEFVKVIFLLLVIWFYYSITIFIFCFY